MNQKRKIAVDTANDNILKQHVTGYLENEIPDYISAGISKYLSKEIPVEKKQEATAYLEKEIIDDLQDRLTSHLGGDTSSYSEVSIADYLERSMPAYIERNMPAYIERNMPAYIERGIRKYRETETPEYMEAHVKGYLDETIETNLLSALPKYLEQYKISSDQESELREYLAQEIGADLQSRMEHVPGDKISYVEAHIPNYLENNLSIYIERGIRKYQDKHVDRAMSADDQPVAANDQEEKTVKDDRARSTDDQVEVANDEAVFQLADLQSNILPFVKEALKSHLTEEYNSSTLRGDYNHPYVTKFYNDDLQIAVSLEVSENLKNILIVNQEGIELGTYLTDENIDYINQHLYSFIVTGTNKLIDDGMLSGPKMKISDDGEIQLLGDGKLQLSEHHIKGELSRMSPEFIINKIVPLKINSDMDPDDRAEWNEVIKKVEETDAYDWATKSVYQNKEIRNMTNDVATDQQVEIGNYVYDNAFRYTEEALKPYLTKTEWYSEEVIFQVGDGVNYTMQFNLEDNMGESAEKGEYITRDGMNYIQKILPSTLVSTVNKLIDDGILNSQKLWVSDDGEIQLPGSGEIDLSKDQKITLFNSLLEDEKGERLESLPEDEKGLLLKSLPEEHATNLLKYISQEKGSTHNPEGSNLVAAISQSDKVLDINSFIPIANQNLEENSVNNLHSVTEDMNSYYQNDNHYALIA